MELRSQRQKKGANEYAELKITLSGLGFFEEDMELTEMREILQALQMSEEDIGKEMHETEFGFPDVGNVINSTMINQRQTSVDSPTSSPEPHFEVFTVEALVHRPMNWSPSGGNNVNENDEEDLEVSSLSLCRKRNTEQCASTTASKRLCLNSIENAPDSGICLSNATSSNPSPVSEENWDDDSFPLTAHSSTQIHSELSGNINAFAYKPIACNLSDSDD